MSKTYQLGYESFEANPNIDVDVLETMDEQFQKGYRQAKRDQENEGITVNINVTRIKPTEEVPFKLEWKDFKWVTGCSKYGTLGTDPRLNKLRTDICFYLENKYENGEFSRFRDLTEEMDRIHSVLLVEADRLNPEED